LLLYSCGVFRNPVVTVIGWVGIACLVQAVQSSAASNSPFVAVILSKVATVASFKFIPLFAIGILFYEAYRSGKVPGGTRIAWACCLLAVGLQSGLETMIVDSVLSAVLLLAVNGRLAVLASRPLVYLGAISYTLYLSHQNIGCVLLPRLEREGLGPMSAVVITTVVAFLLADMLHRIVEKPSMQTLRQFDPRSLAIWRRLRVASS